MGRPTLENVPLEIWREILDFLPRADLPAVRLVKSQFAADAAPRLFQKIPLWISIKSLESLTHLSYHPSLRGYVEEIVFSPLQVTRHEDESTYFATVKAALVARSDSMSLFSLQYGKHSSAYRSYIEAQRYLAEGKSFLFLCILSRIKL